MEKIQTLEDFYRVKLDFIPANLKNEIGHFNVFRLDDFIGPKASCLPYSRKDFFKITLISGHNRYDYADKTIEFDGWALLFGNPLVPYDWTGVNDEQSGYFCIFTDGFLQNFSAIKEYPVFKPGGNPIYLLNQEQVETVKAIFAKMMTEIGSDYIYKYDLLRNYVAELIHSALKMQPAETLQRHHNASSRVSSLFMELLERQFPIESPRQSIQLRSANEYAQHLSVHVNHLNRALKETTSKTTTQLIADRILQEAKTLLRHTDWQVAEIARSLGFEEPTHFNNFFKKNINQTPSSFRVV